MQRRFKKLVLMHHQTRSQRGFSREVTEGHAAFAESLGIGMRIPFRKQAKLRVLAVHLFVLLGESIDFNLLCFYLLLQSEVVHSTAIGRVQEQHCKDDAQVEWDEYHGQEQQAAVEDGGCCAQLPG